MKTILILATLSTLISCGRDREILVEKIGVDGKDGYSLVAINGPLQANSACPAGGVVTSLYQDTNRNDSVDLDSDKLVNSFIVCNGLKGDQGNTGAQGIAGQNGTNGIDGKDGRDGDQGIQGVAGHNGTNGTSSILQVINLRRDVCQESLVNFSEVIIKLADGTYLASFSDNVNGYNTRFTILVPNISYQTTDGTNCRFMINSSNQLVKL